MGSVEEEAGPPRECQRKAALWEPGLRKLGHRSCWVPGPRARGSGAAQCRPSHTGFAVLGRDLPRAGPLPCETGHKESKAGMEALELGPGQRPPTPG